jgi:hypothetical protein
MIDFPSGCFLSAIHRGIDVERRVLNNQTSALALKTQGALSSYHVDHQVEILPLRKRQQAGNLMNSDFVAEVNLSMTVHESDESEQDYRKRQIEETN